MKQMKSVMARVLIAALVLGMMPVMKNTESDAATKVKLSASKLSIKVKKTKKLTVKKAKKYKVSWKIKNKKIAKIKKSGKYTVKVTGKKAGKTTITCTLKKGKKKKKLTCKVTVTKGGKSTATPAVSATPTATATGTASATAGATASPTDTPSPTPSATPSLTLDMSIPSLKESYQGVIDNMGVALAYNQTWNNRTEMQEASTMEFVDRHFNSFTLENEMKPEGILGSQNATLISVEEAKKQGYVIGDNYKETTVPKMNLEMVDQVLAIAKAHNIRMRAHTLMWHQQTPTWFFKKGYSGSGEVVDTKTMDARLEVFVRTMVRHVLDQEMKLGGEPGSLVYAWDVINEYIHRSNAATSPTWTTVYGDLGMRPTYVKAAFQYAYDELKKKNAQDKVVLVSNDYDTYFNVQDEIALVNYINEGESAKICGGIGMQSHVDIKRPTIEEYEKALEAFMNTGLEVQLTELDITINFDTDGDHPTYSYKNEGETLEEQAAFTKDFMKMVVDKHKNRDKSLSPKGITGITIWGISDDTSWRGSCEPLFFTRTRARDPETNKLLRDPVTNKILYTNKAKPAYNAFIEAVK